MLKCFQAVLYTYMSACSSVLVAFRLSTKCSIQQLYAMSFALVQVYSRWQSCSMIVALQTLCWFGSSSHHCYWIIIKWSIHVIISNYHFQIFPCYTIANSSLLISANQNSRNYACSMVSYNLSGNIMLISCNSSILCVWHELENNHFTLLDSLHNKSDMITPACICSVVVSAMPTYLVTGCRGCQCPQNSHQ